MPTGSISRSATRAPTTAPSEAPNPTIANNRSPSDFVVDDVGERPELRDDHQAEDANPDEVRDRERHARLREEIEHDQAGGEECRHRVDQPHPRTIGDELRVHRHDERQHHDLSGGHVGLELGRSFAQNQRLAHGFEDVVGHQDEEHVEREEQRRDPFARVHIREHAEKPVERRAVIRVSRRHSAIQSPLYSPRQLYRPPQRVQPSTLRMMDQRGCLGAASSPRIQYL